MRHLSTNCNMISSGNAQNLHKIIKKIFKKYFRTVIFDKSRHKQLLNSFDKYNELIIHLKATIDLFNQT